MLSKSKDLCDKDMDTEVGVKSRRRWLVRKPLNKFSATTRTISARFLSPTPYIVIKKENNCLKREEAIQPQRKGLNFLNKLRQTDKETERSRTENAEYSIAYLEKTPTLIDAKPKEYKNIFYDPKRGDFEIEYDNDLELLIAEMEFTDNDTSEEIALKYEVLEIFSRRLNRRNAIKDFVIDRKLLNLNELNKIDKKRTK